MHPLPPQIVQPPGAPLVRRERKFIVGRAAGEALRAALSPLLAPDPHVAAAGQTHCLVRNLYFDASDLRFYYDAVRARAERFKVRLRRYEMPDCAPSPWYLEVKVRRGEACVKPDRVEIAGGLLADHVARFGGVRIRELVDLAGRPDLAVTAAVWRHVLEPTMLITYRREPLVCPFGTGFRATFDDDVRARPTADPFARPGSPVAFGGEIFEVKAGGVVPQAAAQVVGRFPPPPGRTSKYCRAMEAYHPRLRAELALQERVRRLGRLVGRAPTELRAAETFAGDDGD